MRVDIMLFKDGRLLLSEAGKPIDGDSLTGLLICITDPKENQVLTYNGSMWVNADLPEPEEEEAAGGEG